ncbi:MAG: hypothetical protein E7395_00475 [Ruminococcaceae bacterium]|nr:hypothetical protein [Oscillospiraceae bacterium]
MIKNYTIADFNIAVNIDSDDYFEQMLSQYENNFSSQPHITYVIKRTGEKIEVDFKNLVNISPDKYYCKVDGNDAIINYDPVAGKIIALTKYNHNFTAVEITSYDVTNDYDISTRNFNHNLMGNSMHHVAAMHSGFVFHSSSLCCSDGGVLFSAESGTGKSTHTALWLSEFDDAQIINDDTPIIKLNRTGGVDLCGTPWAGTTGINLNKVVPLKAIVFIERSKTNSIRRVTDKETIKLFFEAVIPPLNPRMYAEYVSTFNSIYSSVPMYVLSCNMDPEAAHVARNAVFL